MLDAAHAGFHRGESAFLAVRVRLDGDALGRSFLDDGAQLGFGVDLLARIGVGGARALGMDDKIGSIEVGKKADLVLIKNDRSPVMFPILHPYGHVVLQAQRGDVDTVVVNGRVVKRAGQLVDVDLARARSAVESTIEHLRSDMGEEAWAAGMQPEIPDTKILDNPYTYTDFRTDSTHAN